MKNEDLKVLDDQIKLFHQTGLYCISGNDLDKQGLNKDMVTEVIQKLLARLYVTRYKIMSCFQNLCLSTQLGIVQLINIMKRLE